MEYNIKEVFYFEELYTYSPQFAGNSTRVDVHSYNTFDEAIDKWKFYVKCAEKDNEFSHNRVVITPVTKGFIVDEM